MTSSAVISRQLDDLGGVPGDLENLGRVSSGLADALMPITLRGRSWAAKPTIMPAWVLPVTLHTMT